MKMKKTLCSVLILLLMLASLPSILAKPTSNATVDNAAMQVTVKIPDNAVQIAENVFSLGTSEVDGKIVEGFLFVHYREGFAKPPWAGNGKDKGNTESEPYALLGNGVKWKETPEDYYLGPGISGFSNAISKSFDTWEQVDPENSEDNIDIFGNEVISTYPLEPDVSNEDGINEIMFGNIDNPGAIAVTIVWGIFRGPPQGREIVGYDMVFDNVDFTWTVLGSTKEDELYQTGSMDMQNIATHELGHALGLDDLYNGAAMEQTMYGYAVAGETKKRTLAAGDIAGVNALYG
jgi:hypothetical protein